MLVALVMQQEGTLTRELFEEFLEVIVAHKDIIKPSHGVLLSLRHMYKKDEEDQFVDMLQTLRKHYAHNGSVVECIDNILENVEPVS